MFLEVRKVIKPYASPRVVLANSRLQALFEAIPFADKERYLQNQKVSHCTKLTKVKKKDFFIALLFDVRA